jgi:hypothetical protein
MGEGSGCQPVRGNSQIGGKGPATDGPGKESVILVWIFAGLFVAALLLTNSGGRKILSVFLLLVAGFFFVLALEDGDPFTQGIVVFWLVPLAAAGVVWWIDSALK